MKIKLLLTLVCVSCFTGIGSAQKVLKDITYDFSTKGKYESPKKSKFSAEAKNGVLIIKQKQILPEDFGLSFFAMSDNSKYYNLTETFDFKFKEGDPEGAIGLSVLTSDKAGYNGYFSTTQFLISANGGLKYYSGPLTSDEIGHPVYTEKSEPCSSYIPGETNRVSLIRDGHYWYLVLNGDTVRKSYEIKQEPIANLFSGKLKFAGKCQVEIDNLRFMLFEDQELEAAKDAKFNAISGSYLTYSSCLKSKSKRVTLVLKYNSEKSNFTITGLGNEPITIYLDETKPNEFTNDDKIGVDIGGENYLMRRFKITANEDRSRCNVTFNMFTQDYKSKTDCDFDGDK